MSLKKRGAGSDLNRDNWVTQMHNGSTEMGTWQKADEVGWGLL